jgi:hypothetical protein
MTSVLTLMQDQERDALSLGFGGKSLTSKAKIHELLAGYAAILAGEDDQNAYRAEGVFLGRDMMAASASGPQYMVLLERICTRLKRQLLESYVEETHGPLGKRVFNAVMHGDKVTEEMVSDRSHCGRLINVPDQILFSDRSEGVDQWRAGTRKTGSAQERFHGHVSSHCQRSRPIRQPMHFSILRRPFSSISDYSHADVQSHRQLASEEGIGIREIPRSL